MFVGAFICDCFSLCVAPFFLSSSYQNSNTKSCSVYAYVCVCVGVCVRVWVCVCGHVRDFANDFDLKSDMQTTGLKK